LGQLVAIGRQISHRVLGQSMCRPSGCSSHAILRICDLDGVRAAHAVFAGASVENCTARGARFDGANFTGAVLIETDFSRASMPSAQLTGVSASGAIFRGADLRDADLREADLVTMAPIVVEVLRTAGQSCAIDPETAARLIDETSRAGSAANPATIQAVSSILSEWSVAIPRLVAALREPDGEDPPAGSQGSDPASRRRAFARPARLGRSRSHAADRGARQASSRFVKQLRREVIPVTNWFKTWSGETGLEPRVTSLGN